MKVIYNSNFAIPFTSTSLISKTLLLLAFTLLTTVSLFAQCTDNYVQIGSYHIEFVEVRYDFPTTGQSTWYYTVEATSGKDISHVTFPLNKNCIDVLDAGVWGDNVDEMFSGQGIPEVGKDPKAKIWGVKFDEGVNTSETQNYYFTLDKNYAVEAVEKMAIKAGKPFYFGTICGPSPDCNDSVDKPAISCISGQVFDDANQNGIRDKDEAPLANVAVTLYYDLGIWESIVTGTDGTYSFCNLNPQTYAVFMATPLGNIVTMPNVGSDDFDSDIVLQGFTDPIVINVVGEGFANIDGGFYNNGSEIFTFDAEKADSPLYINHQTKKYPNTFKGETSSTTQTTEMQIFPNPTVKEVTITKQQNNNQDVVIEIRDQNFNLIRTTTLDSSNRQTTFDLSQLPNGIYYAHFISNKKSTIKKIVKIN